MTGAQKESVQERAWRLLKAIKEMTEDTEQPIFVEEIAADLGMSEVEVQGAFRYLKDKCWVDTFSIPYTGRINGLGHDAIVEFERRARSSRDETRAIEQGRTTEWDVFISHANEDKEEFARPLADRLRQRGLRVWFDEFTLAVGDSLRRSIDAGLARSRFGIVIISPDFMRKEWPQKELDGLVAREIDGVKVVLPVWHKIGAAEIRARSPMLADRLAASSDNGLEHVVDQLIVAIQRDHKPLATGESSARPTRLDFDAAAQRQERARLAIITTRWEPAGLRLDLKYRPESAHIGISARVTLLSPVGATLKEGRPVINPAPLASGGYIRYDVGGSFVEGVGTVRLRPLEVASELVLGGVMFLAPPENATRPLAMARIRIEILTDADERLFSDEMAISPLG